jgi:anti-sigma factor ChrR (cupin superfamily)
MSCELYDWKSYAMGEMDSSGRREAEAHAAVCPNCREELATLRLTLDTLSTLREEEIPRRIAFVSDQIFEPRWHQRAFSSLWSPNFAAACVIAVAILVHAFARPASNDQIQAQVEAAVSKAVANVEANDAEHIDRVVRSYDSRYSDIYKQVSGLVRQ